MTMLVHIPIFLLTLFPVSLGFDGFDFVFKADPNAPRALLTKPDGDRFSNLPKKEFTFCLYAYLENIYGEVPTIVSYSSKDTGWYNELYLEINLGRKAYTALTIHGESAVFNEIPVLNDWAHICLSWSSNSGHVHLFLNGKEVQGDGGTKVQLGNTVGGNGYFVLCQDQDYFDGGYDATEGCKGRVTQFNLWARELTAAEVNEVMNNTLTGDVIAWSNSSWQFSGGIMLEETTAPIYTGCGEVQKSTLCQHAQRTNMASYDLESGFENGHSKKVTGTLKNMTIPGMKEFSYCFVLYNRISGYVFEPITYQTVDGASVITFGYEATPRGLYFGVGNQKVKLTNYSISGGTHITLCVTWSSATGELILYRNGRVTNVFNDISKNYVVPSNGKLVITQVQFAPLNKENPTEGFMYKASDFYLWSRLLTQKEMASFHTCTGSVTGYLVDASNSQWEVKDKRVRLEFC